MDDIAFFGLDKSYSENAVDELEVFPDNWDAVQVYIACQTQWIVGGMGSIIGLNYQSVKIVADLKKVWSEDLLWRIQVIESEALRILSDGRQHGKSKN